MAQNTPQAGQESPGTAEPEPGGPAKGPGDLPKRSWGAVLKRTGKEFQEDELTDIAAALTYYGVLSVFPALIAVVSIMGLLGSSAIQSVIDELGGLAPGPVKSTLTSILEQLQGSSGAGLALVIGLVLAIWSASGYVAAFMRAGNRIYDIREGRPFWKTLPTRFFTTVAVLVMLSLVAVAVVVSGGVARTVGDALGLGDTAVTVWSFAKWPVMVLLVSVVFSLLYWAAPNVKRRFRWVSPGSLLAVLIWIVASVAFAFYVANFAGYNQTYGSLAGIIISLVWLWISNIAILLGLEFNAELERQRAMETGHPEDEEPYAEPRDTRKM
ncbi:YihY/virulence factor BrkB family protein [Streptomyces sp. DSM 42041]|uniref:YihY/virulence factor BrkB family protein n=1 Tax=Streptomyces hazeniae TaxID=3075538 RepID=A0ABU2NNE7_9ACTN|nr:YihY/virulence factor BrkB family protein [Streptomyces sp. DSM 42041]MDT0378496.1 YihY/virulence factor BrkB family protein [Streptomyces sp. DSM 42041]